jgi:phage baseplate assembly protein W
LRRSFEVKFNGTAAIAYGSVVEVLVDDPDNPTAAYQIKTKDQVTYTREEPRKERFAQLPNFITATVQKVTIYTGSNGESITYLTIEPI